MRLRSGLNTPERKEASLRAASDAGPSEGTAAQRRAAAPPPDMSAAGDDRTILQEKQPDMAASGAGNKMLGYEWPNFYIKGRRINAVMATVHFNIFLYATAFFISIGVLPYLNKKLGADPVTFGYLQTTFSVIQLAGGPPFGRFGDLFGGRMALTLAFASCAVQYGIMSVTYTIPLLFLSRLPSAFMHAMQGGQMIVTDMTPPPGRADALGRLSVAYGVGMIVGPFIGGTINQSFGEQGAAFVACLMSLFSVVLCLYFVPAKTKQLQEEAAAPQAEETASGASVFSLKKYLSLLKNREACLLLTIKILLALPLGIFQSMFSVVVIENFQLSPQQNGYLMSYVGLIIMVMQGFGVGLLLKRFEEKTLIRWATFGLIWAWLLMSVVQNTVQFCVVIIPHCVFQVIINLIVTSSLTLTVADQDSGAMLGMNMAVHSLVRSVSPTTGGYMLQYWGFPSFGYLGAGLSALVALYLFTVHRK